MAKGGVAGCYHVTSRIHLLLIFETKIADKHDFLSFILRFLWRQRDVGREGEGAERVNCETVTISLAFRFSRSHSFRYFVFLNVILSDVAKVKT